MILDWWLNNVTFIGYDLNHKMLDVVADFAGEAAAFGIMVLMLPLTIVLMLFGLFSTIIPMVLCVAWLPFGLLLAIVRKLRGK